MKLHNPSIRDFASDNYAGAHPEVSEAIAEANHGHRSAYGGDVYAEKLRAIMRELFGAQAETFHVFNGTGATVLALMSLLPRWVSIIAATTAHINTEEGRAPERVGGLKLLTVSAQNRITSTNTIARLAGCVGCAHSTRPSETWTTSPRPSSTRLERGLRSQADSRSEALGPAAARA